jgi:hypothetical protein
MPVFPTVYIQPPSEARDVGALTVCPQWWDWSFLYCICLWTLGRDQVLGELLDQKHGVRHAAL